MGELKLRDYQERMIEEARQAVRRGSKGLLFYLSVGAGKCWAPGTRFLMADGTTKAVEDIRIGDRVLGPGGSARTVIGTTSGIADMYRIVPVKGEPFVVSGNHLLHLHLTNGVSGSYPRVVNVPVREFMRWPGYRQQVYKLVRSPVDFPFRNLPLHPYILGVWLGDGGKHHAHVHLNNTNKMPVLEKLSRVAMETLGVEVKVYKEGRHSIRVSLGDGTGTFFNLLHELGVYRSKHIPLAYKTASREQRLELLAGLLDTDGYYHHGHFEIVSASPKLAEDILYLARSLGFAAYAKEKLVKLDGWDEPRVYYRISISGDFASLPTARHHVKPRKQKKCVLRTGIKRIEPLGLGIYYGFQVDADDGLVLHEDFTVDHNTESAIAMMRSAWEKGYRTIFFAHRRQLVEQTANRFRKYGIEPTIIMDGYEFDPSKRLVVASFQTWESRSRFLDREYALVFFDEAHIGVARQLRILQDIRATTPNAIAVGLTATPMTNQGPGLGAVYDTLIHGPPIVELQERGYLVKAEYYMMQPIDWHPQQEIAIKGGEYEEESVFKWFREKAIIGDVINNWMDNFMGLPTIVFARSVQQSVFIAEQFGKAGIPAAHIDFRTPDKTRHRILEDFRNGRIFVLTNVDIFSEGFDMPDMRVAILATPIRSLQRYIQRVGRVLRPAPGKDKAIIVDHGGVLQEHGRVEDYLEWALEPARPDRSYPAHAVKKVADHTRKCPICGHEFKPGPKVCPNCGYDFYRLPPGYAPPIIPATMVAYEEGKRLLREGKKKRCRPAQIPIGATKEKIWRSLLHMAHLRGYKPGFATILYYSATCECPNFRKPSVEELMAEFGNEEMPFAAHIRKRYFAMSKYGYFKDANECFSRSSHVKRLT